MTKNQAQGWIVGIGLLWALGHWVVYRETHPPSPEDLRQRAEIQLMKTQKELEAGDERIKLITLRESAKINAVTALCRAAIKIAKTASDSENIFIGRALIVWGIGRCGVDSLGNIRGIVVR